jgi:hypothetical protein
MFIFLDCLVAKLIVFSPFLIFGQIDKDAMADAQRAMQEQAMNSNSATVLHTFLSFLVLMCVYL